MSFVEQKEDGPSVDIKVSTLPPTPGEAAARAVYLGLPVVAAAGAQVAELISGELPEAGRLLGVGMMLAAVQTSALDRALRSDPDASPVQPGLHAKASAPKADI